MSEGLNLTEEDVNNPYYTVRDVAVLFKVNEATARKWFREKEIQNGVNPGGKGWRARRSDVMAFAQKEYGSESVR